LAGAYALGSGTGVVPAGACSTTLNIQSNAGMIDSGTTARGLYRWMNCHTVLG